MTRSSLLLIALLIIAAVSCDWSQYRHDEFGSGVASYSSNIQTHWKNAIRAKWQQHSAYVINTSQKLIFIMAFNFDAKYQYIEQVGIYGFDLETGSLSREFEINNDLLQVKIDLADPIVIGSKHLAIGVYKFDPTNSNIVYKGVGTFDTVLGTIDMSFFTNTPNPYQSVQALSSVPNGNTILFTQAISYNETIVYSVPTGGSSSSTWKYTLSGSSSWAWEPLQITYTSYPGGVYVFEPASNSVVKLHPQKGNEIWKTQLPSDAQGSITHRKITIGRGVSAGLVFYSGFIQRAWNNVEMYAYAFAQDTGALKWVTRLEDLPIQTYPTYKCSQVIPTSSGDRVFLACTDYNGTTIAKVISMDALSGKVNWAVNTTTYQCLNAIMSTATNHFVVTCMHKAVFVDINTGIAQIVALDENFQVQDAVMDSSDRLYYCGFDYSEGSANIQCNRFAVYSTTEQMNE